MELPKFFEPEKIEQKWYDYWNETGCFKPKTDEKSPCYSIVIPPPNITGSLHMGHALNITLQDILCRWKRMSGHRVLWVPGTDHAGIATQNVVERQLESEGLTRQELGREEFIKRIWKWKDEYGGRIVHQLKRLGASCDWSMERFTFDEGLSEAVRRVFNSLFEEGLIYRSLRLINWCPRCHTALSDLEVDHDELTGRLTYIRYPLEHEKGFIVVATTRPETMLGDTGVAVNPKDVRYAHHIGSMIKLPLTDRIIPIIADPEVDMKFGTGAVKVTPSHDFNDEAIANRQSPKLSFITVIDEDAKMNKNVPERFRGLDRYECRKQVIEELEAGNFLEKHADHLHSVGQCYRCKTVIEPLPAIQWYVNVGDMSKQALSAVKTGNIKIIPEGWTNSYYSWMENIRDWCISRQIWWGHRIPVWYCPECIGSDGLSHGENIYHTFFKEYKGQTEGTYYNLRIIGLTHKEIIENSDKIKVDIKVKPHSSMKELERCPVCGSENLIMEPDVLDTWFSSALWPFSTLGWPEDNENLKSFYPTSVLVTGFDILFFWVARMIMMGMKFMNDIPFKDVYIHALVRDIKGQKMSKSKGNVIDPLTLIDKYGTDSFRFTLAAFAAQGRDVRFAEDRVEGYRHFVNKLWNASRFIQMNISQADGSSMNKTVFSKSYFTAKHNSLSLPDKWILGRLAAAASEIDKHLNGYRFNDAANTIYQFIWHELCDWYIEFSKTSLILNEEGKLSERGQYTLKTLMYVLDNSLRLLHPFMPFVTEEIWNSMFSLNKKSISLEPYPNNLSASKTSVREMQTVIDVILGIRSIKGELNIAPSKRLDVYIKPLAKDVEKNISENIDYIINLARLNTIEIDSVIERIKGSAIHINAGFEIYIPLIGLFDVDSEADRMNKELAKIDEALKTLDKKLFNEDFLNRAPEAVVQKEKSRYAELITKKKKINENLKNLIDTQSKS
ncbi:MAG: valine--tRNA ligase [Nitrospirae bacterium]|nr:valine--tRNA ligase [Nitrospirota bacterium]